MAVVTYHDPTLDITNITHTSDKASGAVSCAYLSSGLQEIGLLTRHAVCSSSRVHKVGARFKGDLHIDPGMFYCRNISIRSGISIVPSQLIFCKKHTPDKHGYIGSFCNRFGKFESLIMLAKRNEEELVESLK